MYRHFFSGALLISALIASSRIGLAKLPDLEFPEGKSEVTIPLQRGGYHLLVPVKLNGREMGLFLVDTGASSTCIDRKLIRELNLPHPTTTSSLNNDRDVKVEKYAINELEVGGLKAREIFVMAIDMQSMHNEQVNIPIVGILGMESFLKRIPFTIDWSHATLTCYKNEFPADPAAIKAPIFEQSNCAVISASIGGGMIGPFLIDTGNGGDWTLTYEWAELHRKFLDSIQREAMEATDVAALRDYLVSHLSDSMLAGISIGNSEVGYPVQPFFRGVPPQVGMGVLRKFQMTIDMRAGTAWFKPDPNQGIPAEWSIKGFDVHSADAFMITPLMRAIMLHDQAHITGFLEAGSDINALDYENRSVLDFACNADDLVTARKLIAGGAAIETQNKFQRTPLHSAANHGSPELVKLLLDHGAKVDVPDFNDRTSLIFAAERGKPETVELLIKAGANLNAMSAKSGTAINTAAAQGQTEAFKCLLAAGADLGRTDRQRRPLLFAAANGGSAEIVRMLIEKGMKVDVTDATGATPLFAAAKHNRPEIVQLLLEHGADPNVMDRSKWTALDVAAIASNTEQIMHMLYFETRQPTTSPAH